MSNAIDSSRKSNPLRRIYHLRVCAISLGHVADRKPTCNAGKPERPRVYKVSTLESFVSSESWLFFDLLEVHPTFFECVSPEEWELYSYFQQLQRVICNLKVINDPAEHGVKLYCITCIFILLSQGSNKTLKQAH